MKRYQVNIKNGEPVVLEFNLDFVYANHRLKSDKGIPYPYDQIPPMNHSGMATLSQNNSISESLLEEITQSTEEEAWKAFEKVIGEYQRKLERKLEQAKEWAWKIPSWVKNDND